VCGRMLGGGGGGGGGRCGWEVWRGVYLGERGSSGLVGHLSQHVADLVAQQGAAVDEGVRQSLRWGSRWEEVSVTRMFVLKREGLAHTIAASAVPSSRRANMARYRLNIENDVFMSRCLSSSTDRLAEGGAGSIDMCADSNGALKGQAINLAHQTNNRFQERRRTCCPCA
jgi:hypothetical protein